MGGKHELGRQELNGGILATDETRNEHGLRRGTKMCSAGSCGRSKFGGASSTNPHSFPSVVDPCLIRASKRLVLNRLRNAEWEICG